MLKQDLIVMPEKLPDILKRPKRLNTSYKCARYYARTFHKLNTSYDQGGHASLNAIAQFDADAAQIFHAVQWAQSNSDLGYAIDMMVMTLADATSGFASIRFLPHDRIGLLNLAIEAARRTKQWQALSATLGNLATCYAHLGDFTQAGLCLNEVDKLNQEYDFSEEQKSLLLHTKANISMLRGDYNEAVKILNLALDKSQSNNAIARVYIGLCNGLLNLGKFREAVDFLHRAHTIVEELESFELQIDILNSHASHFNMLGLHERAIASWQQALQNAQQLKDRTREAFLLNNIAASEFQRQNFQDAVIYSRSAIEVANDINDPHTLAIAFSNLGQAYTFLGEYDTALAQLNQAITLEAPFEHGSAIATNMLHIAEILMHKGDFEAASEELKEALKQLAITDSPDIHLSEEITKFLKDVDELSRKKAAGETPCVVLKTRIPSTRWQIDREMANDLYKSANRHKVSRETALEKLEEARDIFYKLGLNEEFHQTNALINHFYTQQ